MTRFRIGTLVAVAVVTAAVWSVHLLGQSAAPSAGDWPQWQGPARNNLSTETGLLKQWPQSGPPTLWTIQTLGSGYGSVAVKGDRIFVQASNRGQSIVYALDRA